MKAREEELLTESEAARVIRMSKSFLAKSRSEGHRKGHLQGPPWVKMGKAVRYDPEDLRNWILKNKVEG